MGVQINHNGERYDGFWSKGKWHGKGRRVFPNGNVYLGEYKQSLKHGNGIL